MFIKKLIKKRSFFLVGCFMLVLVNLQGMNIELLRSTRNVFPQDAELGHCSPAFGSLLWELGVIKSLYQFAAEYLNEIGREAEEIKAVPVGPGEGDLEEKAVPAGRRQGVPEAKHVAPEEKKAVQIFPLSSADWKTTQPGDSATERLIQEIFHMVMGGLSISHIERNIARYITPKMIGKILGTIERYRINPQGDLKEQLKAILLADSKNEVKTYTDTLEQDRDLKISELLEPGETVDRLKAALEAANGAVREAVSDLREETDKKSKGSDSSKDMREVSNKIREITDEINKTEESLRSSDSTEESGSNDSQLLSKLRADLEDLERRRAGMRQELKLSSSKKSEQQKDSQEIIKDKRQDVAEKRQALENIQKKVVAIRNCKKDCDEAIGYIDRHIPKSAETVAQYITKSLHECSFFGDNQNPQNPLFPPYTTHAILLAFMTRKASTQADLQSYFEGFNEGYGSPEGSPIATFTPGESYTGHDLEQIRTTIQGDLASLFTNNQLFEDLVCSELIKRGTTGLPNVTEYRTVLYNWISFADCVETTIRMLCNIIAYATGQESFQPPDTASKAIKDFYADPTNKKVGNIAHPAVHEAWAPVVSNQAGILYNRMKVADQQTSVCARACGYSGFVRGIDQPRDSKPVTLDIGKNKVSAHAVTLPNGLKIAIIHNLGNRYKLYEMDPSVRNIIIQLNRLYNLDLYRELTAEVYFKADFNQTYFPALCAKFPQWRIVSGADNLDNKDLKNNIHITIEVLREQFTIHLSPGHGYVTVKHEAAAREGWKTRVVERAIQILTTAGGDPHEKMKAWYLIGLYGGRRNIWDLYNNDNGKMYARNALYGGKYLAQEATRFEIVKDIIDHERFELYPLANRLIPTFSMQADLLYPTEILRAYGSKIEQLESLQGGIGAMMKQVAKSSFMNDDYLRGLGYLVRKDQAFIEAIQAVRQGVASSNPSVRLGAQELLESLFRSSRTLVEKDQAFGEATQIAQTGMAIRDPGVQHNALNLFTKLVKKDQAFGEATSAAGTAMRTSGEYIVQIEALNLFTKLVEKGQAFGEATSAAVTGMRTSGEYNVQREALNLFTKLVEKGQAFGEATSAAVTGMRTRGEYNVQGAALNLFKKLIEKDQAFGEATEAAQQAMTNQNLLAAVELFIKLVEKDQAFEEATKAAKAGIANYNSYVRAAALNLINALRKHGVDIVIDEGYGSDKEYDPEFKRIEHYDEFEFVEAEN